MAVHDELELVVTANDDVEVAAHDAVPVVDAGEAAEDKLDTVEAADDVVVDTSEAAEDVVDAVDAAEAVAAHDAVEV